MKAQLYRILKWFSLHIFGTISGTLLLSWLGLAVVDLTLAKHLIFALIEIMRSPTPLWVAIALPVAAYLLLKTTISRSSITPKKEKPNLSKKTEMQEQILNAFKTETNLDNIAKILNVEPTLVRRNVDILSKDLLIAWCGSGSPSWYLTEHGRAYLYPTP